MGFMQRFERSLENSTSDAFARVFGGALTPLEVEHALRRESGDKLQELPDGQLLSPNHFIVTLSPGDAQRFANDEATSPRVVSRHLDSYLYDQDWGVVGDVVVEFTEPDDLRDGQYRLMSECNDKVDARQLPRFISTRSTGPASNISPNATAFGNNGGNNHGDTDNTNGAGSDGIRGGGSGAQNNAGISHTAMLVDKESGNTLCVLSPGATLVGRGDDVVFRIPDTGVSRHHARIDWDGVTATITDLNSTNGTAVNGIRISQWQLSNNDEIIMGHTHFLIRIQ